MGNNNDGSFEKLTKLNAQFYSRITSWIEKKQQKDFHHDTQNKSIRLMVSIILRDIAKISTVANSSR